MSRRVKPASSDLAEKRQRRQSGLERVLPNKDSAAGRRAAAAQDALLARVWQERGKQFCTVNQAIAEGYLTNDDWVDELDRQREGLPLTQGLSDEGKAKLSQKMREVWARRKA